MWSCKVECREEMWPQTVILTGSVYHRSCCSLLLLLIKCSSLFWGEGGATVLALPNVPPTLRVCVVPEQPKFLGTASKPAQTLTRKELFLLILSQNKSTLFPGVTSIFKISVPQNHVSIKLFLKRKYIQYDTELLIIPLYLLH